MRGSLRDKSVIFFAVAIGVLIGCSGIDHYIYKPPVYNPPPDVNDPPSEPRIYSPQDSSIAPSNVTLEWRSFDPERDTLTFDIYLGTENPPGLVVSDYIGFSWSPEQVDEYATYYWKIVAKDSHGLTSEGPVWSFTTLQRVRLLGSCGSGGFAYRLALSANYAYIADGSEGLRVIDIGDPFAPDTVGSYNTWGFATGISVKDYYVFLASGGNGLQIFDVYNPASPDSITTIREPESYVRCSAIRDDYAYISASGELLIADIADIGNPTIVGRCDLPLVGESISISGNYAYIAVNQSGICIVDITDAGSPEVVGTMETEYSATDIFALGNYAYITDEIFGLIIADISNPQAPYMVGSYDLPNASFGVCADSQYAYIANDGYGLRIFDISDPQAPVMIGYYGSPAEGRDVEVQNGLIYICGRWNDLSILQLE